MARAVASPSTSSGRHISCPSGPVMPSSIIFSDCCTERRKGGVCSSCASSSKRTASMRSPFSAWTCATAPSSLQRMKALSSCSRTDQWLYIHQTGVRTCINLIIAKHEDIFVCEKHLEGVDTCTWRVDVCRLCSTHLTQPFSLTSVSISWWTRSLHHVTPTWNE